MNEIKRRAKKEPRYVDKGNWNYINTYWIFILGAIFYGVQALLYRLVDLQGVRISDTTIIKRAIVSTELLPVTAAGVITSIVFLAVIIGILYISVSVLPKEKKHDRLRLAGIFVISGSIIKIILSYITLETALVIEMGESFKLPMPTCADLYILGGLIAMIVIFKKNYSNQEVEEIIQTWKTKRANKKAN